MMPPADGVRPLTVGNGWASTAGGQACRRRRPTAVVSSPAVSPVGRTAAAQRRACVSRQRAPIHGCRVPPTLLPPCIPHSVRLALCRSGSSTCATKSRSVSAAGRPTLPPSRIAHPFPPAPLPQEIIPGVFLSSNGATMRSKARLREENIREQDLSATCSPFPPSPHPDPRKKCCTIWASPALCACGRRSRRAWSRPSTPMSLSAWVDFGGRGKCAWPTRSSSHSPLLSVSARGPRYLVIDLADQEQQSIMEHYPRTRNFIDSVLSRGGRVLLHCNGGISQR